MSAKYTFLIPAYKGRFFQQSLESILSQTLSDFDVIVSDDFSPENLKCVVDAFNDSRVTYRRNSSNIGAEHLVEHWNLLLNLAKSEYVIMASDDDVYAPDFLEKMDALQLKHPNVSLLRPHISYIDAAGNITWSESAMCDEVISGRELLSLEISTAFVSGIPQYVFKRQALLNIGGFVNYPMAWYSDDATVSLLAQTGVAVCPDNLFFFRLSGESISTKKMDDWSEKLIASTKYADLLQTLYSSEDDHSFLNEAWDRIRKLTIILLNESSCSTFFRIICLMRHLDSPLYPFMWRMKRLIGRLYHKVLKF